MSDFRIGTIEGRESGVVTDVQQLKYQLATAWVNFDGTGTVAIRDSYNVAGITDNGTGDYTVNFAQSMDNSDYSFVSGSERNGTSPGYLTSRSRGLSSILLNTWVSDGTSAADHNAVCVSIFGGLN